MPTAQALRDGLRPFRRHTTAPATAHRFTDGDFMGGTAAGFLLACWFFPGPAPESGSVESAR